MTVISLENNEFGVYPQEYLDEYHLELRDLMNDEVNEIICQVNRIERGIAYMIIDGITLQEKESFYMTLKKGRTGDILWYGKGVVLPEGIILRENYQPFETSPDNIIKI